MSKKEAEVMITQFSVMFERDGHHYTFKGEEIERHPGLGTGNQSIEASVWRHSVQAVRDDGVKAIVILTPKWEIEQVFDCVAG